ncbi:MAG TPA: hypothetical protein VFQ61_38755 [Polyangiaceae bacterium]|nr:hypothetical protein [Polyangiaceae bacterium]
MTPEPQTIARRVLTLHLGIALATSAFICLFMMLLCLFQGDGGWSWTFFSILCAVFFPVLVTRKLGETVRIHALALPDIAANVGVRRSLIRQLARWLGVVGLALTLTLMVPISYLPLHNLRFTLVTTGLHAALFVIMTIDQLLSVKKSLSIG